MKHNRIIRAILFGLAIAGIALIYSKAESLRKEDELKNRVDVSGVWLKSGYFCRDGEAHDSPEREWGWGFYHLKQNGNSIQGSYQNENYPWKYELNGSLKESNLVFRVNNLTEPKDSQGRTNGWVYRGIVREKNTEIRGYGSSWNSDLKRVNNGDVEKIKRQKMK